MLNKIESFYPNYLFIQSKSEYPIGDIEIGHSGNKDTQWQKLSGISDGRS